MKRVILAARLGDFSPLLMTTVALRLEASSTKWQAHW